MPSRIAFLDWVLAQEGKPYIWGAKGPEQFDCSGLVTAAIREVGGPDLRMMYNCARLYSLLLPTDKPVKGDLCFYGLKDRPTHVMVFIGPTVFGASGGGKQTTTPVAHAKVQYKPRVTYRPDFLGYRKLPF